MISKYIKLYFDTLISYSLCLKKSYSFEYKRFEFQNAAIMYIKSKSIL